MGSLKDDLSQVIITEADRKRLSPKELADLEALIKELSAADPQPMTVHNPDKLDWSKGTMQPLGKGPVNWKKPSK